MILAQYYVIAQGAVSPTFSFLSSSSRRNLSKLLVCIFPPGGLHFFLMIYFIATSTVTARMSTVIVNDRYKQKNSTMNKTTMNRINNTDSFSQASFI